MKKCIFLAGFLILVLSISNPVTAADTDNISYVNPSIPDNGCYVGAYLGGSANDQSSDTLDNFNNKTGKKHSLLSRYVDISDSKNPNHWTWAQKVKNKGAIPIFIYDPYTGGLEGTNTNNVQYFADKCRDLNTPVFVVYGHEMNINGYIWAQKPELYKNKFIQVAKIFHTTAPLVQMCWVPNQNWGYPWGGTDYGDGYTEYYPEGGATFNGVYRDYVDWVGLNLYERDWDNNDQIPPDMFIANIKNGKENNNAPYINFYETFAVAKNKPMIITETGAFDASLDSSSQINNKNQWISQVYDTSTLKNEFPMLHAICYFNVKKYESGVLSDFRIPNTGTYNTLIADPYFIGAFDFIAPTITSISPANGATNVVFNKTITVTFGEAIKDGDNFWIELKNNVGTPISFTKSISGKVLTIDPTINLEESLYTLIIHTGAVTDLSGNPVAYKAVKFSVGYSPKVISTNPAYGATRVARSKTITVAFNENIKAGKKYWIELISSKGKSVSISKSISGKILTIKHTTLLAANTKYKLILHTGCVTDKAGNPLSAKFIYFTTKST